MGGPRISAETVHASTVAKEGRAVLITGPSGAGKSDLALRLLDLFECFRIVERFGIDFGCRRVAAGFYHLCQGVLFKLRCSFDGRD